MTKVIKKPAKKTPTKKKTTEKPPKRATAGQPPKFSDTQIMQDKINEYFAECDTAEPARPYTISGLAYHLEMTTHSLRNYEKKEEYFTLINRAKQKVERNFEERLTSPSATGSMFWLKNHAGYRDKTETDLNMSGEVIHKIERTIIKPKV